MDTLPQELILHIFDFITLITDKRQFLKTCVSYNKLTKHPMQTFEKKYYVKRLYKTKKNNVEKFTKELCRDRYFDMIPMSYINPNNKVIVKMLVKFNCLPKLMEAKNNGCDLQYICYHTGTYGHIEILKWARENGYEWGDCARNAGSYGHLETLKWARENGCDWDSGVCTFAAKHGHLDILIWARENGCDWDSDVCRYAAEYGHLDILIWARENGCEWTSYVCLVAAIQGYLEILKWAMGNGCDWTIYAYNRAKQIGNLDIVKWIEDNGFHNIIIY